ncbi:XtrA/YqaO family protein [Metabacillus fastidiosus]|uniref:XtrA/YqaO family protein n=1 Tax=Metabacillus fastidiosus TaxID=1458 RepID=UPI000824AE8D|nr:XtrA/YqaO family protein [Metabacillus fastidiosus]MED4461839.1 XtrA/YqaO family protein [Metabacillus fastidiosus]
MRLRDLKIDTRFIELQDDTIDLKKGSFAIVLCEGKAKFTVLPPHGETKIVTHQGKVKRVKFDEGEDF